MGGKLLSSARKLPEADREPQESAGEAGDGAFTPTFTRINLNFPRLHRRCDSWITLLRDQIPVSPLPLCSITFP